MYNITGEDVTSLPEFLHGFARSVVKAPNTRCIIVDAANTLSGIKFDEEEIIYGSGTCKDVVERIINTKGEYPEYNEANKNYRKNAKKR